MIVHLVLFTPKADLAAGERDRFVAALEATVAAIPEVRRFRVCRRLRLGVSYETRVPVEYDFAGIVEFDDGAGLRAYLEHPAHAELGRLFWECSERAVAFDFEAAESADALRAWGVAPAAG